MRQGYRRWRAARCGPPRPSARRAVPAFCRSTSTRRSDRSHPNRIGDVLRPRRGNQCGLDLTGETAQDAEVLALDAQRDRGLDGRAVLELADLDARAGIRVELPAKRVEHPVGASLLELVQQHEQLRCVAREPTWDDVVIDLRIVAAHVRARPSPRDASRAPLRQSVSPDRSRPGCCLPAPRCGRGIGAFPEAHPAGQAERLTSRLASDQPCTSNQWHHSTINRS